MPTQKTHVRIFAASPGDVTAERDALDEVAADLSHSLDGVHVEVLRWERDTYPAMGRAQGLVFDQMGEDFDILVGIMWKRFGSPTGEAESGTEEEFDRAYARWQQTGQPPILFYFCERPFFPRTDREVEQFQKVQAFRQRLEGSGLIGTYEAVDDFKRKVRRALDATIRRDVLGKVPAQSTDASAEQTAPTLPDADTHEPVPSRFGDIPMPRRRARATDLDKHRFVRDGFSTIVSYFEDAGDRLRQSDPALDVDLETESSRAFRATVFENGQARSRCRIWISDSMGAEQIAYLEGGRGGGFSNNSMNDYVNVAETDGGLAFALSGMDFSTQPGQVVDAEGAARHFWTRFTRPLDDASRSPWG
ncbi:MAG: hypothetical protein AAGI91_00650 [Bacteroidota bacterium]